MATNANPAPKTVVKSSVKLEGCITAIMANEAAGALLYDKYCATAKSEAVRLQITDRGTLTALLKLSGDKDLRRISVVCGFVFPANAANRATLDKIVETNTAAKDGNKRIPRDVIREIQSAKEPMTVEQAKAAVKAKQDEKKSREPGGETKQVESGKGKTKKLTAAEVTKQLQALISAALTFAEEHGYDLADFNSEVEIVNAEVGLEDPDADDEGDEDDSE